MPAQPPIWRPLSVAGLAETRRFVREGHARMTVVFFALLYAIGSMALGGMILIAHVPGGYTTEVLWGNALGTGWWNYPGLLIVAPWGVISLPLLATLSMFAVSLGVGLGVTVALLISVSLIRQRRAGATRAGGVGTVAGLTPAMIALVTLGACCSTTAAATAGVGLVAQASGSSVDTLLVNNWYLDVFQISIVYVALLAQELVLRVYGGLFGLSEGGQPASVRSAGDGRTVAIGALRAALLLAGVTWCLAMVAEWTSPVPPSGGGYLWFQWIFQHLLLGAFAVIVALIPLWLAASYSRTRPPVQLLLRGSLLLAGLALAVGTPPMVAAGGAPGFLNELLGVLGFPSSWGAVQPVFSAGPALYSRWVFQYLLLGGFAVVFALRPSSVLRVMSSGTGARAETTANSPGGGLRFPSVDGSWTDPSPAITAPPGALVTPTGATGNGRRP